MTANAGRAPELRRAWTLAGIVPFAVYVLLGLGLPTAAIAVGAFQNPDTGQFTLNNVDIATHGIYLHGFLITTELSLITSVVPGILGLFIGYAIYTARRGAVLRRIT